jgi:recombination protein RecR
MDSTQKLIELFKEFPGIGPRQAKRFVYFLLTRNNGYATELTKLISEIKSNVAVCPSCYRFFTLNPARSGVGRSASADLAENGSKSINCHVCSDDTRDQSVLMIVSHDIDFENVEKTKFFNGYYFILGGTVPILEKNPEKRIRQKELLEVIDKKNGLKEIIIALNYNPEGENTLVYLKQILKPLTDKRNIKISTLGRGLSTGTELEYSDSDTIKNALKNRQ